MVLLRNLLLTVLIHFSSYMYAQDRIPLNRQFYQVEKWLYIPVRFKLS
jgi:hypothetical protein